MSLDITIPEWIWPAVFVTWLLKNNHLLQSIIIAILFKLAKEKKDKYGQIRPGKELIGNIANYYKRRTIDNGHG